MAGDGGGGGGCVQRNASGRTRENGDSGGKLRRGRRDRLFRRALRTAQVDQRASELLLLGTEELHRREFDSAAMGPRRRSEVLSERRKRSDPGPLLRDG